MKRKKKKTVEEREAEFLAMTPQQKRVTIARDTIEQVEAKKFRPRRGHWLIIGTWTGGRRGYFDPTPGEADARGAIELRSTTCAGCAMGGMFASLIRRTNGVTVGATQLAGFGDIAYAMRDIFDKVQLRLIEAAFERRVNACDIDRAAAGRWGSKFDNEADRLLAIMRNIVRNKGEFVLPPSAYRRKGAA